MRGMYSAAAALQGPFETEITLPEFSPRKMEGSLQV